MNKKMEVFDFQSQEVRVLLDDKQGPWFVGKDVCSYFGDTNHKRSLSRIDDDEKTIVEIIDSLGRKQQATAVNEPGLYSLLFAFEPEMARYDGVSPNAPRITERIEKIKTFKRWITHEVLPSIRKTGSYSMEKPRGAAALVAQAELLLLAMKQLAEVEERQFEHDARLSNIEMVIAALPDPNYKTVVAYANENSKSLTTQEARWLGYRCKQYSKQYGYTIEKVPHPLYGFVNAYHVDVFKSVTI